MVLLISLCTCALCYKNQVRLKRSRKDITWGNFRAVYNARTSSVIFLCVFVCEHINMFVCVLVHVYIHAHVCMWEVHICMFRHADGGQGTIATVFLQVFVVLRLGF